MNFYDLQNPYPPNIPIIPNNMSGNPNTIPIDINYKINELETRLKKIELRLQRLESSNMDSNYNEPDTNLYMI